MNKITIKKSLTINLVVVIMSVFAQAQELKEKAVDYNNQGVIQMNVGKYETSVKLFKQAIILQPNYATAYYNLGSAYYHLKEFEKAINAIELAIKLYPNYPEAYNQLGVTFTETEQYNKAINAFKKSNSPKAH